MAQDEAKRMVLLDGLRGVAAFMVLLYHVEPFGSAPAFLRGYLFVDLFFLLSGFVLTLAFDQKFGAGLGMASFLRLRWRRFQPMIMAGALLGALANFQDYNPLILIGVTIAACLMIPQGVADPLYQTNAAQWSLLDELIANAFHAGLLHKLGLRQLAAILTTCGVGFAICVHHSGNANLGSAAATMLPGLLRTGWSYIMGTLLARAWLAGIRPPRTDWRLPLLAPCAVTLALPYSGLPVWIGDLGVILAVFPALFWLALGSTPSVSASRWLALLGALSFPLYALHIPVLTLWDRYVLPGHDGASGIPAVILSAMLTALLFHHFARRPVAARANATG